MPLEPDAAQRRALLDLLRRELRAAHARVLAAGAPSQEISSLLEERIRRLGGGRAAGPGRSAHRQRGDDVEDRGDDPVDLGGVVQ